MANAPVYGQGTRDLCERALREYLEEQIKHHANLLFSDLAGSESGEDVIFWRHTNGLKLVRHTIEMMHDIVEDAFDLKGK